MTVKILAWNSEGDPLFIQVDGDVFEVEEVWATDARFLKWPSSPHEKAWHAGRTTGPSVLFNANVFETLFTSVPGSDERLPFDEPLIVKPSARLFLACALPSLGQRSDDERRARAIEKLGGRPNEDPVTMRRELSHRRKWMQEHPKARPSHASIVPAEGVDDIRAAPTHEEANERRMRALRRLQDPPEDPTARDIRYLLDGLRSRPVL